MSDEPKFTEDGIPICPDCGIPMRGPKGPPTENNPWSKEDKCCCPRCYGTAYALRGTWKKLRGPKEKP